MPANHDVAYDAFFWTAILGLVFLTLIQLVLRFAAPDRSVRVELLGVVMALFALGATGAFLQMLLTTRGQDAVIDAARVLPYLRQALVIAGYVLLPLLFRPRPAA